MTDSDDQERADFLYGLMHSGQWEDFAGRPAKEVIEFLGPPSDVWVLDHDGHLWARAVYRFSTLPSQATDEEREAFRRDMHFTPSLLFRDGIGVPSSRFDTEVLGGKAPAGPPRGVEWRRGELFP
jgi:hypothetical protein